MDATIAFTPHPHTTLQTLTIHPRDLLTQTLTQLVRSCPPVKAAQTPHLGFYQGPTSIAYLFFHLAKSHPQLEVHGKLPLAWFEAYFSAGDEITRAKAEVGAGNQASFGIASEYFCHLALHAAHTRETESFLYAVDQIQLGDVQEVLLGCAGLLVLLRFVKEFVPEAAPQIDSVIKTVIAHITNSSSWEFQGREYLGAAHGTIGIITQVCLTGHAPKVQTPLAAFLGRQLDDGNWKSTEDRDHEHMQWCHGVPGCVISLLSIKRFFPNMKDEIQTAIKKGQELIFKKGIIEKEPCLCHGVTGNALALEADQRAHLLSFATPEGIMERVWVPSSDRAGLYCGAAGRAWVWAMLDKGRQGFPAYTDGTCVD